MAQYYPASLLALTMTEKTFGLVVTHIFLVTPISVCVYCSLHVLDTLVYHKKSSCVVTGVLSILLDIHVEC